MLNTMSKKALGLAMIAALGLGVLAGCGSAGKEGQQGGGAAPGGQELSGTVTASGSTALQPLVQQAAKEFMEKNPRVSIQVSGGGSGTGLKNVADGTSDIGNSDVKAGDEFKDKGLKEHIVAIAPFAIIVNKDVNVENLTKQQAADIFTGKITNWKEVGGKDQKIVVVTRPDSSGSLKLVKQLVLDGKSVTKDAVVQESSGAMVTAVTTTAGAIGYVDTAYVKEGIKAVKFDGVAFSKEAIKDGTYKLYGEERMYTKGEPQGAVKAFLDYILSNEFQSKRVEELKFLPANLLKK
ncbi:phosphate ABC transporter substrate-binding protein [Effusibacillus consociatus]|uniref:Phosphate-binding protein n=1 Tax=Effusibacillus consociatus TaxID=1117041 RepID=A0ABV9Q342_9BACL